VGIEVEGLLDRIRYLVELERLGTGEAIGEETERLRWRLASAVKRDVAVIEEGSVDVERNAKSRPETRETLRIERAPPSSEQGLWDGEEVVAIDDRVVAEPVFRPDRHLRR
jgi:hypothetical protein